MAKQWCCYCGKTIDWLEPNRFVWAGIVFHGTCREEAIANALRSAQREIEERVKQN